jgi:hypothetical protein
MDPQKIGSLFSRPKFAVAMTSPTSAQSSDEQRAFVDHGLVEVSGLSVFRMVAPDNRAAKILSESSNDFFAHNVPPEYS